MGCAASRIENEERVRVCKERKRLMKQLLVHRKEFADSQLGYLRSLKNSGVTLRQFTESELLEPDDIPFKPMLPPSPPPPLPPSPPPPPAFSPDIREFAGRQPVDVSQEEVIEIGNNDSNTPPPPVLSSSLELCDNFGSSSPNSDGKSETVEQDEEENWAETQSEFMEEGEEGECIHYSGGDILSEKPQLFELMDDSLSMTSWHTRDTAEMAMVVWNNNKSLAGIIRELDDYFLKASAGGEGVAVLMDINISEMLLFSFRKMQFCLVFKRLDMGWSSKVLSTKGSAMHPGPDATCKPGGHCNTLEKLYCEEQKLLKLVKELESTKMEHERKSFLLQKQDEEHDESKTEKAQSTVESLQVKILSLQESISLAGSAILDLIHDELNPQMIALISGQLSHILVDDVQRDGCPSSLHSLSQEWLYALDSLPHKMVSEAIKSLLSGIQSIIEQQEQEVRLHKKSDKLEKKLERESTVLAEMEMKSAMSFNCDDAGSVLNSNHPFSIKRAKFEVLKKKVGDEKDKYMSSIKVTQAMILNTLQTTLPNVFQALMRFSDAYAQALKSVLDHASLTEAEGSNA
ncbi:hypothetical protein Leryth_018204 [Lithospermum erythrorhizon]|nr:hypothetical protein Leryth_018204 [Lithospermum erythrorhizon]